MSCEIKLSGNALLLGTSAPLALRLLAWREGSWHFLETDDGCHWRGTFIAAKLNLGPGDTEIDYDVEFESSMPTHLRLALQSREAGPGFHLIAANIHGDNNASGVSSDEFPLLTPARAGSRFASPEWEFRADRASLPASLFCSADGAAGVSISPYANREDGSRICNGLFAQLPGTFGVTLGYRNFPVTFVSKGNPGAVTSDPARQAQASGRIWLPRGSGRTAAHSIVRSLYSQLREQPSHHRTKQEAASALVDGFLNHCWSDELGNYANSLCRGPENPILKPWRPLVEIGWTGGGPIAFSLLAAGRALDLPAGIFGHRRTPETILDDIAGSENPASGLFHDLVEPWARWPDSRENGWWAGYLVKDCHCAYTNGQAAYYLLRASRFFESAAGRHAARWQESALRVLDVVLSLQREDGAFGYTFSTERAEVIDWEGFAGCWFSAALGLAYGQTGEARYFLGAQRSLEYYSRFVADLQCWGTPMDTWRSVDQEGNLAFVHAARILHQITGDSHYLDLLRLGAEYEYLWRYGFRTKPAARPLKDTTWNSCGGSITSVSNPHAHPMGLLITSDLDYLADKTGDLYHRSRADDGVSWLLQTMELYPGTAGYGSYGILSERFCPSDGLLTETYADGSPSSIWFTLNGWAGACGLEALSGRLFRESAPPLVNF